jgi:hypothetical protein
VSIAKLIDLSKNTNVPAWAFHSIWHHKDNNPFEDDTFIEIFENLLGRNETRVIVNNLKMLFHGETASSISDPIKKFGRKLLQHFFDTVTQESREIKDHDLKNIARKCLTLEVPFEEDKILVTSLVRAIYENRMYSFSFPELIHDFCRFMPRFMLDEACNVSEHKQSAINQILGRESFRRKSPIESIDVATLIEWCQTDSAERFLLMSEHVKLFESETGSEMAVQEISGDALDFLSAAPDKIVIIKHFYGRCYPKSWSGSLLSIMKSRRNALKKLHANPDSEITKASKHYEQEVIKQEESVAKREAKRDAETERKFE